MAPWRRRTRSRRRRRLRRGRSRLIPAWPRAAPRSATRCSTETGIGQGPSVSSDVRSSSRRTIRQLTSTMECIWPGWEGMTRQSPKRVVHWSSTPCHSSWARCWGITSTRGGSTKHRSRNSRRHWRWIRPLSRHVSSSGTPCCRQAHIRRRSRNSRKRCGYPAEAHSPPHGWDARLLAPAGGPRRKLFWPSLSKSPGSDTCRPTALR